jgi:hypothetical protein
LKTGETNNPLAVKPEWVSEVFLLLGKELPSEEVESLVASMVPKAIVARRLIDWIPEAAAMVLIPHICSVKLPETFSARTKRGRWVEFGFAAEPIVAATVIIAIEALHSERKQHVLNFASRSSMMDTINRALAEGESLDSIGGGVLSGPALNGIPAEIYQPRGGSLWRRLPWF